MEKAFKLFQTYTKSSPNNAQLFLKIYDDESGEVTDRQGEWHFTFENVEHLTEILEEHLTNSDSKV